jgi:hypothetical protein
VGITTGSRGKIPGKTCEKKIRNNNNNSNNNNKNKALRMIHLFTDFVTPLLMTILCG